MDGMYKGNMVVSLSGRDRGVVCIVLQDEGEYLCITDGKKHKVEHPKKKKRKHVRLITGASDTPKRYDGTMLTNRFVRTWLRTEVGCEQA